MDISFKWIWDIKLLSFLFLIISLSSCNGPNQTKLKETNPSITSSDQSRGSGGKCYLKMKLGDEILWTEVLCQQQITKRLVKQIQVDLLKLKYKIDENELSNSKFGSTTRQAIKTFQLKNNMAYGGLDWATINRLKQRTLNL